MLISEQYKYFTSPPLKVNISTPFFATMKKKYIKKTLLVLYYWIITYYTEIKKIPSMFYMFTKPITVYKHCSKRVLYCHFIPDKCLQNNTYMMIILLIYLFEQKPNRKLLIHLLYITLSLFLIILSKKWKKKIYDVNILCYAHPPANPSKT